jgi:hypothetical protein
VKCRGTKRRNALEEGPRHRLMGQDLRTMTAICSVCGPVMIAYRDTFARKGRPQCINKIERSKTATNDKHQEWRKEHGKTKYQQARLLNLIRKYGITLEQYESSLCCDICSREFVYGDGHLRKCVDHDHATGKFRGFLCHDCNVTLGHAQDDAERLRAAADYLDHHRDSGSVAVA